MTRHNTHAAENYKCASDAGCPVDTPKCDGYKKNVRWGTCVKDEKLTAKVHAAENLRELKEGEKEGWSHNQCFWGKKELAGYKFPAGNSGLSDCKEKCDNNPHCTGATYAPIKEDGKAHCWLRTGESVKKSCPNGLAYESKRENAAHAAAERKHAAAEHRHAAEEHAAAERRHAAHEHIVDSVQHRVLEKQLHWDAEHSMKYSSNCKGDDTPTALFMYNAHLGDRGDHRSHSGSMLSCQKETAAGRPDETTMGDMKAAYSRLVGEKDRSKIRIDAHAMKLESSSLADQAKSLRERRLASNCHAGARPSDTTFVNKYTCHYLGKGVDTNGREVRNPMQKWSGTLASCDRTAQVSSQTEHDVRVLAYDQAEGKEAKLNIDEFVCSISSIPHV